MLKVIFSLMALLLSTQSFAQNSPLKVGDKAPNFKLQNASGQMVELSDMLEDGPVILTWYRGAWCPYCNLALKGWETNNSRIEDMGAKFVALTPQMPDNSLTQKEKDNLDFTILTDAGSKVAAKYGVAFKLDDATNKRYEEAISLSEYNGNDEGMLPIPATYIIDTDGVIKYAYVNEDYSVRADPEVVIEELKKLK